jgi:hypothetical protein
MHRNSASEEDDWDIDQYFLPGGILDPDASERASESRNQRLTFMAAATTNGLNESILPETAPSSYGSSHLSTLPVPVPQNLSLPSNPWNTSSPSRIVPLPAETNARFSEEGSTTKSLDSLVGSLDAINDKPAPPWKSSIPSLSYLDDIVTHRGPASEASAADDGLIPPEPAHRSIVVPPPGFEAVDRKSHVLQQWVLSPPTLSIPPIPSAQRADGALLANVSHSIERTITQDSWFSTQSKNDSESGADLTNEETNNVTTESKPSLNETNSGELGNQVNAEASASVLAFSDEATAASLLASRPSDQTKLQQVIVSPAHAAFAIGSKPATIEPSTTMTESLAPLQGYDDGNNSSAQRLNNLRSPPNNRRKGRIDDIRAPPLADERRVDIEQPNISAVHDDPDCQPHTFAGTESTATSDAPTYKSLRRRGRKQNIERPDRETTTPALMNNTHVAPNIPAEEPPHENDHDRKHQLERTQLRPVASNSLSGDTITGLGSRTYRTLTAISDVYGAAQFRQSIEWMRAMLLYLWKYAYVIVMGLMSIIALAVDEAAVGPYLHDVLDPLRVNLRTDGPPATPSSLLCYVGFGLVPVVCDWVMEHADFPHLTPHVISHVVLYLLCSLDRRPNDIEVAVSPRRGKPAAFGGNSSSGSKPFFGQQCSLDDDRPKLSYNLSIWMLRTIRLSLPLNFLLDGFSDSNASFMTVRSSFRLTQAYTLALTKKSLLLSPVAWIGWSLQILIATYIPAGYLLNAFLFVVGMATIRLVDTLQVIVNK